MVLNGGVQHHLEILLSRERIHGSVWSGKIRFGKDAVFESNPKEDLPCFFKDFSYKKYRKNPVVNSN